MARTVKPKSGVSQKVVSLKVTLRDTKPPVWRRLLVPGETTLADLHRAIQAAMGWEDYHLHTFDIAGRQYGDPGAVDDVADETRVTLNGLIKSGVTRFAYTYDFGDNWDHALVIEKSLPAVEALSRPICTAGKRKCPPEDCGGPWGYRELLDVLADPAHPEHAERREWLGEDFDPRAIAFGIFGPSDAVGGSVFGTCGRVWAAATPSFDANSAVEDQMR
jgi:hypothetical protein